MKKIYTLICFLGVLFPSYSQLVNTAYVANYGGGITTGGRLSSYYSVGDKSASDELATGQNLAVYPGFIPGNFIVLSFGLAKDSAVLVVLYESTKGNQWLQKGGWLQDSDLNNWYGVNIDPASQRVSELLLPGNNLQNNFPELIKNLDKLEKIDVSDNNLKKFPNVSTMPNLTELALEKNDFSFTDIAPNLKVATLSYAPQDPYGKVSSDTVEASGSIALRGSIPGATAYQWQFDPFATLAEDFANLEGQNASSIGINNLDYQKMGAYKAVATSNLIPGFEIETSRKYVWATTEVFGTVRVDGQPLTSGAEVALFRIKRTGAYDSSRVGQAKSDGTYELGSVVLGNFVLKVNPNSRLEGQNQIIQTYYVSQDDWLKADTLAVLEKKEGIDIDVLFIPPPPVGSAKISGFLESDLPEDRTYDDEGRVTSRRKVKKAACSMRRFKSQGRPGQDVEDEIAYYIETDDEGFFNFEDVADGKYLLNIQFPGIPMDPSSDVVFEIGGDRENQVFEVNALITELGIQVDAEEILFNWKPFIKDVKLYPNPTEGILGVDYTVYRNIENLKLVLCDISGVKLIEEEVSHFKGRQNTSLDMRHLSAGNYILIFTGDGGSLENSIKVVRK